MGKALEKYLAKKAILESLSRGGEKHVFVDGSRRQKNEEYLSMSDDIDEKNSLGDIGSLPLSAIFDTQALMDMHESREKPGDEKVEIGVVHVDEANRRVTVASKKISSNRLGTIVNILIHGKSRGRRR